MKLTRRITAIGAVTLACAAAAVVAGGPSSRAGDSGMPVMAADSQPGYAVEDFGYPDADKIKAEKGIVLKRGDGHIVLVDCSSATGLMEVWSRKNGKACFRTTGTSGWLTLEIPMAFAVKGSADHTADVTLTAPDATPQEVPVGVGEWTPVGESADPQARDFTLMEIRTSK
ncbi:hypothetical protein [Streptomyces sp. NPDC001348]